MILLFQIGDFYETFDEDAQLIARELGLVLTRKYFGKDNVRPLAGIPLRSLESHLAKLIHRGFKVAVCNQVTPPGGCCAVPMPMRLPSYLPHSTMDNG